MKEDNFDTKTFYEELSLNITQLQGMEIMSKRFFTMQIDLQAVITRLEIGLIKSIYTMLQAFCIKSIYTMLQAVMINDTKFSTHAMQTAMIYLSNYEW